MTQNTIPYSSGGPGSYNYAQSASSKFPDPFLDIASTYVPRDIIRMFEWSEALYYNQGTYRSASRRVVRYFLTDLVFDEVSNDTTREEYRSLFEDDLKIITALAEIGDNYIAYGNVFVSLYFPFRRLLTCPECRTVYEAEKFPYNFKTSPTPHFEGHCPKCDYEGTFKREDVRSTERDRLSIRCWDPKRIRLRHHPVSGRTQYFYEPDSRLVEFVRSNKRFYINDLPWDMLEAFAPGSAGQAPLYEFSPGYIYHLKEASLAGVDIKGWAIPPMLPNFKLAYYIQLLHRLDEAIAHDYILPFRIIFPKTAASPSMGMDSLMSTNMDRFASRVQAIVSEHRKDPTTVHTAPMEVGYQAVGGEGKQLTPKESMEYATDELLNAVGFPADLYHGSLSIQAFPVALRLFEKTWSSLVGGYNDVLQWFSDRVSRHFGWDPAKVSLRSVTLADDIERKALAFQAAAGMDISKATAYRPLGIDFLQEQRAVVEEQKEIQRLQQEAMEEAEASQFQMGGGGGGDPNAPGGAPGATPGDVHEQARELAHQLVIQTPETLRRGELLKIRNSNPTLHALVLQEMNNLRQELSRQGQAVMIEQEKQASFDGKSADDLPSPMVLGLLITSEAMAYNRKALRKIAMASIKDEHVMNALKHIQYRRGGVL